nr:MAG TPA: hypothetical protein [Caudoviricetes sp.]
MVGAFFVHYMDIVLVSCLFLPTPQIFPTVHEC